MEKLTDWEKEYINTHLAERVKTDCYYDNPNLAIEDIEWLLEIIKKLNSEEHVQNIKETPGRYTEKLDKDFDDDIYTVEDWEQAVKDGCFCNFDGSGYWVKDALKSNDEVFSTPKLDATHVVWYNK